MHRTSIRIGDVRIVANLRDTPTADAIYRALPVRSRVRTWGKEVYFPVPLSVELEADARDVLAAGELAFWVEGQCIAIGFGPTPLSRGDEIRLAARTNIWGRTGDDVTRLDAAMDGDEVVLERADQQERGGCRTVTGGFR